MISYFYSDASPTVTLMIKIKIQLEEEDSLKTAIIIRQLKYWFLNVYYDAK